MKKLVIVLISLCAVSGVQARKVTSFQGMKKYIEQQAVPEITTKKQLDFVLRNYTHVIAYVSTGQKPALIALMEDFVKDREDDFAATRVKFVSINGTSDDLPAALRQYKLGAGVAHIVYFKNRRLQREQLVGQDFSAEKFESFIKKTKIEDAVAFALREIDREKQRKRLNRLDYCDGPCGRYCGLGYCRYRADYSAWDFPEYGVYYGPYWAPYWSQNGIAYGWAMAV